MAFWDDWFKSKDALRDEIDEMLIKADNGDHMPDANKVPDEPRDTEPPSEKIGRKAILEDPYFEHLSQSVVYRSKTSRLSNKMLKDVSVRDWLVSAIIQVRSDTILKFSRISHDRFKEGFRIVKQNDKDDIVGDELEEIANLEAFLYNCGRKEHTPQEDRMLFGEFLKLTTRDALTFGHVAIEKIKTRRGGLHRFRPVPAEATYLVNKRASKDLLMKEMANLKAAYGRKADNDPSTEYQVNEADLDYIKYIQVSYDNRAMRLFGDEDMIFELFNPQNFADSLGYCYLPGTTRVLLTDGSSRLVEEVKVGDEVYSHNGKRRKVVELKQREISGSAMTITPYGMMSQQLTDEHPLLIATKEARRSWDHAGKSEDITTKWLSACEVRPGDYVVIPKLKFDVLHDTIDLSRYGDLVGDVVVANATQNCPQHKLPRYCELDQDMGYLLGIYAGDGCIMSGNTVRIDLGPEENEIADRVIRALNRFDVPVRVVDAKCKQIYCSSKVLANLISDLCPGNTWTKSPNSMLLNTTHGFQAGFIAGYIDADGTAYSSGDVHATSVSYDLVSFVALMSNNLGYLAKIKDRQLSDDQGFTNSKEFYRVSFPRAMVYDVLNGMKTEPLKGVASKKHYHEDSKNFYVSVSSVAKREYEGPVYNFEVEVDHSYIANQVATHNCYSPLELAIVNVTNHLNVENYNANFFTHGYAARGIIHLKGTVTQSQMHAFRRHYYNTISGTQHAWRTPIIAGLEEVQWVPLAGNSREMEYINFNNHILRAICAQFQIDPIEVGLDYLVSASPRGAAGKENNQAKIEYSRERGLHPILMFFEDIVNRHVLPAIDETLAQKYRFEFVGYEDETPQTLVAQQQAEMTVHSSMNDLLRTAQKEPIDDTAAKLPMNQLFWGLIEKNYTRGEIREIFFGDEGASKRRELQYIPGDPAFMGWQQLLLTMDRQKIQDKQMKEQAAAQQQQQELENKHAEADHNREQEKHDAEVNQMRDAQAHAVVQHSLKDTAKTFGAADKPLEIGGKSIANPINVSEDSE